MQSKNVIVIIMLFALLVPLTSCWDSRELDDMAIASAIGIDFSKDQYLLTVQILNPSTIATTQPSQAIEVPVSTYQVTGETIFKALRKMTTEVPRKVKLSHVRMVVLGERLAEEKGFMKAMDFLSRDPGMRTDFYLAIARDTRADKVLNIITPVERTPANKLYGSLEESESEWAATGSIQLDELINDFVSDGKHPVLTGVRIEGDPKIGETIRNVEEIDSPAILSYSGMGVMKNDRLKGWLDQQESKGYNYTQGNVSSTIVNVPCSKGGQLGVELLGTEEKNSGNVKNGKPEIDVHLQFEGSVADVECKDIDIMKPETMDELETKVEKDIKNKVDMAVQKAKEFKTDIFGFGNVIQRSNPKAWKKLKNNWDEEFVRLPVNIKVDGEIRRSGSTGESFLNDVKE